MLGASDNIDTDDACSVNLLSHRLSVKVLSIRIKKTNGPACTLAWRNNLCAKNRQSSPVGTYFRFAL